LNHYVCSLTCMWHIFEPLRMQSYLYVTYIWTTTFVSTWRLYAYATRTPRGNTDARKYILVHMCINTHKLSMMYDPVNTCTWLQFFMCTYVFNVYVCVYVYLHISSNSLRNLCMYLRMNVHVFMASQEEKCSMAWVHVNMMANAWHEYTSTWWRMHGMSTRQHDGECMAWVHVNMMANAWHEYTSTWWRMHGN
jgi:hypothetical protein